MGEEERRRGGGTCVGDGVGKDVEERIVLCNE